MFLQRGEVVSFALTGLFRFFLPLYPTWNSSDRKSSTHPPRISYSSKTACELRKIGIMYVAVFLCGSFSTYHWSILLKHLKWILWHLGHKKSLTQLDAGSGWGGLVLQSAHRSCLARWHWLKEDRERGGVNLLASQSSESDEVELFSFSMRTVASWIYMYIYINIY